MKEIKVFRDPIYGYVKVEAELIWNLIQTKEFQRLRRIHQLGGVYVVYHTAEHSRFSHSLGVYEVARRIIYEVDAIRKTLTKEERLITLCAALLHDIGHGPYSHAFEMVFDTIHEEYSIDIILDKNTEVHQLLEKHKKGFSRKVSNIINKKCYNEKCDENTCHHQIMNHIISSQLDADRLDYLQRDAYNSGATYGEIDLERIIRSFLVVDQKIAFKYTSMHAIEDYLMSRYHMYWQVYFHPVGVSYEILLVSIFKRVKYLIQHNFPFKSNIDVIKRFIKKEVDIKTYLELDEPWMICIIKDWRNEEDQILADLSNRFLDRCLFKYIGCQTKEILDNKYNKMVKIFNKYHINTSYYLHRDTIVKEAYQYYNNDSLNKEPILLLVNDELVEIAELSHVVKGIQKVGAKTDYKLYYPKEIIDNLSLEDQKEIHNIIQS
ncbi:HD domain-containing protein [Mycoplasmatota bacterium]|nr:HD domain-containing protein [Mycoplasmatota bacterium]